MTVMLLAPVALRAVLSDLVDAYRAETGDGVETRIVLNPEVPRLIAEGFAFDVGITNPWYVPDLVAAGHVDGGSHTALGRVPLALAVAGHGGGCATDRAAIADCLLGARDIAFTGEGTSGRIFREMAAQLGVLDRIEDRLRPMGAGEPIRAVASGRCAMAAAPLTVVRATDGVQAAAICPAELGTDIEMSVFLAARRSEGAARLLSYLADPARDAALSMAGVERFTLPPAPVHPSPQ
ncbi:solute-binding protein [Rhodobacterales bacterium HKCCSP123]|nr:solute-binding protein [Rhodobacterales bacterium HKCCSP123]